MINALLYDATGKDRRLTLESDVLPELGDNQLLWIDLTRPARTELGRLEKMLDIANLPLTEARHSDQPPSLQNYGKYFHFCVLTPGDGGPGAGLTLPAAGRVDFVVGPEWLVTSHQQSMSFLDSFREQDQGETLIGGLSSASLAAALLDGHLTSYLTHLERLEDFLDEIDVRVLASAPNGNDLLEEVVGARRFVGRLRRSLAPQRVVFYGLARPDFTLVTSSNSADHFKVLTQRFDRVIDAIEHGRELVQGSFDLFSSRVAESTNVLVRRLTFISLAFGAVGTVAGVFGMNFETAYTQTGERGFWTVVLVLLALVAAGGVFSRMKKWI